MTIVRLLPAALLLVSVGCSHPAPVQVSAKDASLNTRWHANLATPSDLAGAVQIKGSASMAPGEGRSTTSVTIALANAAPGGVHPWAVHRGQCSPGVDEGIFGSSDSYKPVKVESDGLARGTADIPVETPETGPYFVEVHASVDNPETIVACGNLAPPTQ